MSHTIIERCKKKIITKCHRKFCQKNEILVQKWNVRKQWNFGPQNGFFDNKINFGQKMEFWSKNDMLVQRWNFRKQWNFGPKNGIFGKKWILAKMEFWSKNEILIKKWNFGQKKMKSWLKLTFANRNSSHTISSKSIFFSKILGQWSFFRFCRFCQKSADDV